MLLSSDKNDDINYYDNKENMSTNSKKTTGFKRNNQNKRISEVTSSLNGINKRNNGLESIEDSRLRIVDKEYD